MKFGLLGHPVAHSLSPRLHTFFLQQLGLTGTYVAWDTPAETLENTLASLWQKGITGLNITVPHKEAVLAHLTSQNPEVMSIGAANTLVQTPYGWQAHNTDISGFGASLPFSLQQGIQQKIVWLLGAGGSAKAVVAALRQHEVGSIVVFSRSQEKTQPLLSWLKATHPTVETYWQEWGKTPPSKSPAVIINTTSVGLSDTDDATAFDWLWHNNDFSHTAAIDLMYRLDRPTAFIQAATLNKCHWHQDGLNMLVHQGADAFTLWTGQTIANELRQQALAHLKTL